MAPVIIWCPGIVFVKDSKTNIYLVHVKKCPFCCNIWRIFFLMNQMWNLAGSICCNFSHEDNPFECIFYMGHCQSWPPTITTDDQIREKLASQMSADLSHFSTLVYSPPMSWYIKYFTLPPSILLLSYNSKMCQDCDMKTVNRIYIYLNMTLT